MNHVARLYLVFGILILGLLGWAEYRGWTWTRPHEARAAPQSLRDNPGAYRPHYYGSGRYHGGK